MNPEDHVCVCHRVSLRKIQAYMNREKPKVASQLSECLDSGTGCGWCVPFLNKLHSQFCDGKPIGLPVNHERYAERRKAYKKRNCTHDENDG